MNFGVDTIRPAAVAIDLHRGHLDPAVATMPFEAGRAAAVVEANRRFFAGCRKAHIPIVHAVAKYRDAEEICSNAFWRTRADNPSASRKNVARHNIAGMPGCEIMPVLHDAASDWVVDTKKRY